LRLSSLDPREVPDRLLDLIAGSEVICSHLHICAQAGDDGVLKQMRRNYDNAYYRELLVKARERLPDAALGSDIIVGFPGESDAAFENSVEFFASLPLTYFHVFPYSKRRGTVAVSLPNHVPGNVKKQRARRMRELGAGKKEAFCRSFLGKRLTVLVEGATDGHIGGRRGFSRNYLPVAVLGGDGLVSHEIFVRVESFTAGRLIGTAMQSEAAVAASR
jgi:threonylcarbamoyladenosine tRNA methylthiotransferase MtaB